MLGNRDKKVLTSLLMIGALGKNFNSVVKKVFESNSACTLKKKGGMSARFNVFLFFRFYLFFILIISNRRRI